MGKLRSMRALMGVGALALGAVVLAGGGVVGCGSADTGSESTASLKEGLTILSSDPAVGVSAAFKRDGRVVYLQTRVGPLKEKLYRDTFPNEPLHEMDARVVDQEGRTFGLVIGADSLIEPGWAKEIQTAGHIMTKAEGIHRQADFILARDGANELGAKAPPELADHVFHLTNMTRVVPQESAHLQEKAALAEATVPSGERTYGSNGCNTNLAEGEVLAKPFALIAQHSSVYGWNYNGCTGTWDEYVNTCNHGTCANDSSMSGQCYSYSNNFQSWTNSTLLDYWSKEMNTTTNNGSNTGGCWSGYGIDVADITVYGSGDPNHECNDDSALEIQEIRNGAYIAGNVTKGIASGYNCEHWTHWYGPLMSDTNAPSCP
jgi:hypothetical protein